MEFPYEELERYELASEIPDNVDRSRLWSVAIYDTDCDCCAYLYGPSQDHINVFYWVLTQEQHDGRTYYEEMAHRDRCEVVA